MPASRSAHRHRVLAHLAVATLVASLLPPAVAPVVPASLGLAPTARAAACTPDVISGSPLPRGTTVLRFKDVGSCDWTVPAEVTSAEVLIVAGGGGGGSACVGGGGGGGGVIHVDATTVTGTIAIHVGAGGAGGPAGDCSFTDGADGGDSSFGGRSAVGGGGGGGGFPRAGRLGGSGGGGSGVFGAGGAGTLGQGNEGGAGTYGDPYGNPGGGGGGFDASGGDATLTTGGEGGAGLSTSISGTVEAVGAGGGGGSDLIAGSGGSGCGGAGASSSAAGSGTGYGCGGGGGNHGSPGGDGSAGVVYVRYRILPVPAAQTQASVRGAPIAFGLPAATSGDAIELATTITGSATDGTDPVALIDPTAGTVDLHYCHDGTIRPTECTSGTWADLTTGLAVDGGADPTDGIATASLSGWTPPDGPGWYLVSTVYRAASGGDYADSSTTGDVAGALVLVGPLSVAISTQASSGGTDLTSGSRRVAPDATVGDVVTLRGFLPLPAGGYLDPTAGTVDLHYCYAADDVPAECSAGTPWIAITDGTGLAVSGGADPTDGIATATLSDWAPPTQPGYYLISATFVPSGPDYTGGSATAETLTGAFRVPGTEGVYIVEQGGTCDAPTFETIQAAVNAATADGQTIHLCRGTYDLTAGVVVGRNLAFEGDLSTNTIVDGGRRTRLFDALGFDVTFRRLTLRDGSTGSLLGDTDVNLSGGAVRALDVTIDSVIVIGNRAKKLGGAIFAGDPDSLLNAPVGFVTVLGSHFEDNATALSEGGAIYARGPVSITDATFIGNSAEGGGGGAIGAATSRSLGLRVERGHFMDNSGANGGAIQAYRSGVIVVDSEFVGNSASEPRSGGGAIFVSTFALVSGSTFTENRGSSGGAIMAGFNPVEPVVIDVTSSHFTGNVAWGYAGGALYTYKGPIHVVDSDFSSNTAMEEYGGGGAIYTYRCEAAPCVDLSGATFADNHGTDGGAVWVDDGGGIAITDGKFTGNSAANGGGAIRSEGPVASDPTLYDDNTAGTGGAIWAAAAVTTVGDTFRNNSATTGDGGAIRSGGFLTVSDGTFSGNVSTLGDGGAIRAVSGGTIADSTFSRNEARDTTDSQGGAVSGGYLTVLRSTFEANVAGESGSAIAGNQQHVTNSTFVDNSAGAAAALYGDDWEIRNATFVGNTGGGAYTGALRVQRPIVANSIFGSAADTCQAFGTLVDLGGNIGVAGSACVDVGQPLSSEVASADALGLGTLAPNAPGTTETVAISDGSAAIGYGLAMTDGTDVCTDDADAWSVGGRDQRGVSRTSGDQTGSPCDSGAYENTTGSRVATAPAVAAAVVTQVSGATATNADPFWDTATVSGTSGDGAGGLVDPTGEVQFYLCYSSVSSGDCDWAAELGDWQPLGDPIELSAGTSDTDGIAATVTSDATTGANGWYVFHASFSSGDTAVYLDGEDTGGTSEIVHVRPAPVVLTYNGPVVLYERTAGSGALASLTASVTPARACPIWFTVIGLEAGSIGTFSASSSGSGIATSAPVFLPAGEYEVSVSTGDECAGAPDFTGVLSVLPPSLPPGRGATGGGWYQASGAPPKVAYGFTVQVTSVTTRSGRYTTTTTTTKGQLLWISKAGWRLKAAVDYSSTDGSTAWALIPCTGATTATQCGRFSGTGILQHYEDGGWATSSFGRVGFVVSVSDGGTANVCKGNGRSKSCSLSDLADSFGITMRSGTRAITTADLVPVNTGDRIPPMYVIQRGSIQVY